jgi:hypothetical protein
LHRSGISHFSPESFQVLLYNIFSGTLFFIGKLLSLRSIWSNWQQSPDVCSGNGAKGAVAQSVEQRIENPCVGGSIPPHTTNIF